MQATIVRTRGFTLIELLIAMAIFAFLILLAGPMYAGFMGNSQIRNASENTLAGVRFAQTAAIKNNKLAKFVLDPTPATGGWAVYVFNDETGAFDLPAAQSYQWAEGASRTKITTLDGATQVTFNGLGRVCQPPLVGPCVNADPSTPLKEIDITNENITSPRSLKIMVSAVGNTGTKLCDPAVLAPDPRACS